MKRMLFAGAVALAAASPALAADLPAAAPPPPQAPATYVPAAPPFSWSGIYIGINGGYGFGNSDWTGTAPFNTGNFDVKGPLVGGTIGVNFQTGQFVFGVEGDGDWSDIKGSIGCPTPASCQTTNDWLGTLRGRLGFAMDRALIYATAGGAAGDVKAARTTGGASISTSTTEFGWTAGAGIEYAITDNVTARAEYLFVDLENGSFACTVATCGVVATVPVSFDASLVRAGLDFKFSPF